MTDFVIFQNRLDKCRVIVTSFEKIEFFGKRCDCRSESVKMIRAIRKNSQRYDAYQLKQLTCGSWQFELYDMTSGEILGHSETYVSESNAQQKMNEMRVIVPSARYKSESKAVSNW